MHPLVNALVGWLVALFATLLFVGVGRAVARLCDAKRVPVSLAFAMGSGVFAILLIVCAFGPPNPPTPQSLVFTEVALVALLCAPIAIWGLRSGSLPRFHWRGKLGPLPLWLVFVLFALWFAPYFVQTLIPDTDWDSAMYHRPTAQRIIDLGATNTDPYRAQLNFPALVPLFYAAFLTCGLSSALTPFNMIVFLLTVWTVYEIGWRTFGPRAGLWAAALTLSTNILLELATDHRNDGFLALYFLASMQAALWIFRKPDQVRLLPFLGMAMGLAFGTKLTGLLAIGLFGGATIVLLWLERPRGFAPWLALGLVLVAVPGSFWTVRNLVELGDPIYPFLNGLVYRAADGEQRPFYPDFEPLYAVAEKPPERFLDDPGGQKEPGTILNLVDVFVDYERYQNKPYHWLQPLLFLAVFLPLFERRPRYLWVCGAALFTFLALGFRAHLVRYALAAYPMLAIASGALLAHVRVRRYAFWPALVITLGVAAANHYAMYAKLDRLAPLDYLLKRVDSYEWLVNRGYNGDTRSSIAQHLVNVEIEQGRMHRTDLIFMIGEGKGDLLLCSSIPDVSAESNTFLAEYLKAGGDYAKLEASLRGYGVTHMMLNEGHVDWIITNLKMDSTLQNKDYLRFSVYHALKFCLKYGTRVFKDNGVWLFKLND